MLGDAPQNQGSDTMLIWPDNNSCGCWLNLFYVVFDSRNVNRNAVKSNMNDRRNVVTDLSEKL